MKFTSLKFVFRVSIIISSVILLLVAFYINLSAVLSSFNMLMDFGSFIASGQFARAGTNPYSNNSPLIFNVYFPKLNHFGSAPNLNPPISVIVFEQIINFPPLSSVIVWRIASVFLYVIPLIFLLRKQNQTHPKMTWRLIWLLNLAGFWHTIELGQIYIPLFLIALGVVIHGKKENFLVSGVLLGVLIAIKPNFVFWAVALGVAGYWQVLLSAGGIAILISLIPLCIYGITIYTQWFEATKIFTPNLLIFPGNNSFQGLSAHFGSSSTGTIIGVFTALTILVFIAKYKPEIDKINLIAIITSLLISPIAWTGYTLFVIPCMIIVEKWEWQQWIAAAIFTVPFFVILAFFQDSFFNFIFFGWFYGWGLLLLLVSEISKIIIRASQDKQTENA